MTLTTQAVSKILWKHDPACTGCNLNAGMEDEYDVVAEIFVAKRSHQNVVVSIAEALEECGLWGEMVDLTPAIFEELVVLK